MMKRFMKRFHCGQKGFTLMELLIVVAILGILAAILVPRLSTFFSTGEVAAANQEVARCETAALAFYADNDGTWPTDTNGAAASLMAPIAYINEEAVVNYGYDVDGLVDPPAGATWGSSGLVWSIEDHEWQKP